jgi:flagellar motor switch protein FliM
MSDNSKKRTTDFLDQSEVDRLLTPSSVPAAPVPGPEAETNERRVERHDFLPLLSDSELRRLRLLHEEFVRYLSARLSLNLRMEFGATVARLTTTAYSKFTDALPRPTHINLFKIEPLSGVGILDISPQLALTIADRLLGGRGHSIKAGRLLTEIEIALIDDIALVVLEEWCGQFKFDQPLRPTIIGNESTGRFLQTAPRNSILLTLTLECSFGDCFEQIQLGIPYYTIEPLMKKLQARESDATSPAARRAEWHESYDHVSVPVRAEWKAFELTLAELLTLRPGDVIELPASVCAETHVLLNGSPKFIGTVGLNADNVAVQLTRKLSPEEPIHAKPDGRKVP